MSDAASEALGAHAIARAEIEAWRGRCLDLFARGELVVTTTLESASSAGCDVKLRHLAGQRLADVRELAVATESTLKQRSALILGLDEWQKMDLHRAILAHGVLKELLDRRGVWCAQFDIAGFKAGKIESQRKSYDRAEALELEKRLGERFKVLSSQLGQLRKRL